MPRAGAIFLLSSALAAASSAGAQQTTAAATLQPICADRPTKANGPCTVDPGHVQIEADLVNASFMNAGGSSADSWLILNPTLKYGLAPRLDVEMNFDPIQIFRTRSQEAAPVTLGGIGDLFVRVKYEYLKASSLQAAIIPYVKAPAARVPLGNGAWEGGLIAPVNIELSRALTLTVQPELDFLETTQGNGRRIAFAQDLSLGLSLPHGFTLFGELWGQWSRDPGGFPRQASADVAGALALGRDTQLDAGVNFGLNSQTPGVAPYIGIAHRF